MMRLLKTLCILLFSCSVATAVFGAADSVSSKTYKELVAIQELMGTGDSEGSIARLKTLLENVEKDTLDEALTLQTLGYAVMANEDFPAAITYLRRSLATNRLPQNVVYNVGYMVAQLHAAQGEFDEALTFAEGWFKQLTEPKPDQYMFMANIYAQVKRYAESVPYAEKAVSMTDEPRESWFQLLTASYFELERFPDAASSLLRMVSFWTDKAAYWEQLASVYMVMDQPEKALASLRLAYDAGFMEKESSIKSMIQLSVMQGVPEHGARLLDSALAAELVPEEEAFLEMLAQAWVNARELDSAVAAYKRQSLIVEEGDPWMKIANIYVEQARWKEAEASVVKALDLELEEPGKAWLLLGISRAELGNFNGSREALRKAKAFTKTERSASSWLKYAEDMKRQADWLAANR